MASDFLAESLAIEAMAILGLNLAFVRFPDCYYGAMTEAPSRLGHTTGLLRFCTVVGERDATQPRSKYVWHKMMNLAILTDAWHARSALLSVTFPC